ncbi:TIR domain-containing protein [Anaerotruncus massiliensis (ex Togo et al. 2019)]|uniref:TIR domain-containing protein n=1 Tax=Anaerotruncus massiliensis (ex Togo et al. 2019) TaxID=1673720 RepID=UPI0027B8D58F|nr:TIR domain-containing protein [Anaerotruncus massiliensis (ex Togo et al. 2019)]
MAKENVVSQEGVAATPQKKKQTRLSQAVCPSVPIEDVLIIPQAIKDNFAGQATPPLLLAEACKISPTSSNWRTLTGAAVAYGITSGAYNAQSISLTHLGERIVAPLIEGDNDIALKEAIMLPTLLADFYQQFDKNKLPRPDIARNILLTKGVPGDKVESTWELLRNNAIKAKILRVISGNEYIFLDRVTSSPNIVDDAESSSLESTHAEQSLPNDVLEKMNIAPPIGTTPAVPLKKEKPNIFISHGKNNAIIIGQLKELLAYGQMEAIVSVERETTAIPVPDKVFDDMRNCDAGIIHIDTEEVPVGNGEQKFNRLNENVLIEIGAAIALYGKRVILLCKKGTVLPSNLQGLYRCEYEGTQLDYASTMKLLKTMQELREMM